MSEYQAEVVPHQPWNENGTANVTPTPPYPHAQVRTLPLENHPRGDITVLRSEYPDGLVIIPADNPPDGTPAILQLRVSSGEQMIIEDDDHVDWPDGIVAWFTD